MSEQNTETTAKTSDTAADRTVTVVTALAANPAVDPKVLPEMISSIHGAFVALDGPIAAPTPDAEAAEKQKPAVPVSKSVKDDYIVCLEDGKKLKTMKRHLRTAYDMSPQEYRQKWGLPADYPMTAPGYSSRRRELALSSGLGRPKVETPAPSRRRAGAKG